MRRAGHFGCALVLAMGMAMMGASPGRAAGQSAERAVLDSLHLRVLPVVADPSNAWQGSAAAAALGKRLFLDSRFSLNQSVACASCHDPARQFQDDRPVAEGLGTGRRRSMPLADARFTTWLFWDGRKDSLWSQALGPMEDPVEHGGNRLRIARLFLENYGQDYADLFGGLPDFAQLAQDASPRGNPAEQDAWRSMSTAAQDSVSRVFANMGKAIAAYESTLRHELSKVDRFIEGTGTLTTQERRGLQLFIGKGQCVSCHNGPLFTDQQFHNTGVPPRDGLDPDAGRLEAVDKVRSDEFNCLGRFSDARPEQCQELRFLLEDETLAGAFRTPGLRGVASRPPYMHAGQYRTLEEVVDHYTSAPQAASGHSELRQFRGAGREPIRLSAGEKKALVAFLKAL